MVNKKIFAGLIAGVLLGTAIAAPILADEFDDLPYIEEDWDEDDWSDYDDYDYEEDDWDDDEEYFPVAPVGGETYDPDDTEYDDWNSTPLSGTAEVTDTVNFRSGPSSSSEKIGTIPAGTKVSVLLLTDNGWYKVNWNGTRGYVFQNYINRGSSAPVIEDYDTDPSWDYENNVPVVGTGTVIETAVFRDSPNGGVIGYISEGTDIDLISMTDSGWYEVFYKGQTGYVYSGLVEDGMPDRGIGHITTSVNFRSSPDPNADNVIGGIPAGAEVEVLDDTYNNWYQVVYQGRTGYVYAVYVEI